MIQTHDCYINKDHPQRCYDFKGCCGCLYKHNKEYKCLYYGKLVKDELGFPMKSTKCETKNGIITKDKPAHTGA